MRLDLNHKPSTHPDEQDMSNSNKLLSKIKAKMSGEMNL